MGRLRDAAKSIGSYVSKKREEYKKGKMDEKFLYVSSASSNYQLLMKQLMRCSDACFRVNS